MDTPDDSSVRDCELCIVGGGYAALNGLNAAAKYLRAGDRVVVVDKNETWGGQWLHQYDFLRLHQPYRMFTAGDQRWALDRPPTYLATRREVIDHLETVPRVSAGHLDVQPLFGHAYTSHRIEDGRVVLDAVPVSGGAPTRIRARRLLRATGIDVQMLAPFPVSSDKVRSVGVSDPVLGTPEFLDGDAPVYVIGSGKTAMDLVLHLVRSGRPGRKVSVLLGSGMWFFCRDTSYRTGPARLFGGTLTGDMFLRITRLFDGTNERDVMEQLARDGIMIHVFGEAGNCRYGLLGLGERDAIRAGVRDVIRGHLVDVEGTRMTVRERGGATRELPVEPGAWLVNCTSHLRALETHPVLEGGGLVATPQYALGFSGTTAYYLTHLWYRDQLAAVAKDLYRVDIDVEPKLRFGCQIGVMVMANMGMVSDHLPLSVTWRFEGDFNKWYPPYRQVPMIARVLASRKMIREKADRLLPLRFGTA